MNLVILFWDDSSQVAEMADDYHPSIILVPADSRGKSDQSIRVGNFTHLQSYPTAYYLDRSQRVAYVTRGATAERALTADHAGIFREMANRTNYERILGEVRTLLE